MLTRTRRTPSFHCQAGFGTLVGMSVPTTIILYGATGDLSRRKLLPGLPRLHQTGLLGDLRIVGTAVDEIDREAFVDLAEKAVREFSELEIKADDWAAFASLLEWAPHSGGPQALRATVIEVEKKFGVPDP